MIGKTKDDNINNFGQLRLIKVDKIHTDIAMNAPTTDINYDDNKLNLTHLFNPNGGQCKMY